MKLYDGYGGWDIKEITLYYDYYMALYDEIVREWSYMIVIGSMIRIWLIFIKVSEVKNITWDYGYYMALYDEIVREWNYMMVMAWITYSR